MIKEVNNANNISKKVDGELTYDPKFPVARAAQLLGVSLASAWRLIWNRKLKCYKIGGRTLVGLSHIEVFLKAAEGGLNE
jgi:Helix-turn-helix domain